MSLLKGKGISMKKIKALFVSTQSLLIAGVIAFLSDDPLISLETKKSLSLKEPHKIENVYYDVIVIDDCYLINGNHLKLNESQENLSYPALPSMRNKELKKIIYTDKHEISHIKRLMNYKLDGIVSKYAENEKLREAIIKVSEGEKYYCPNILNLLYTGTKYDTILTAKEKEVLYYLEEGVGNQEIAAKLSVSVKTIESHKENIRKKLGLKSIKEIFRILQT